MGFLALCGRDRFLNITLSQRPRSFCLFLTLLQTPLCLWLPNVDPDKVTSLDCIDFLDKWQIEHHDELFQKNKETQKELQLKIAATDPCPTWRWVLGALLEKTVVVTPQPYPIQTCNWRELDMWVTLQYMCCFVAWQLANVPITCIQITRF